MSEYDPSFLPMHILNGDYKYSKFDSKYVEDIFFLSGFTLNNNEHKHTPLTHAYGLGEIEYETNSDGYRSPEFVRGVDILFGGCSNTYGVGLPTNFRWTDIIASRSGMSFNSIGIPGASVSTIVQNFMHYFKVYGNPKYLFCMFPDFYRTQIFINSDINISAESPQPNGLYDAHLMSYARYNDRPKYIKRPFGVEDFISQEMSYYQSLKSIQWIEQYCDLNNIKFYWGVFSDMDEAMVQTLKNNKYSYYSHFVFQNQMSWQRDNEYMIDLLWDRELNKASSCHQNLKKQSFGLFDFAADLEYGPDAAHYGFHRNIHVAEVFLNKLMEKSK